MDGDQLERVLGAECHGGPEYEGRWLRGYEYVLASILVHLRTENGPVRLGLNVTTVDVDREKKTVCIGSDVYPDDEDIEMPIEEFVREVKARLYQTLDNSNRSAKGKISVRKKASGSSQVGPRGVVKDMGRVIGTDQYGAPTSVLQVWLNPDDSVASAYPVGADG
ncbi:MAG: hypothetical protein JW722_09130 [Demequinaceae bacterium]|nr:hypothetical protein [Demequinaceae bacterium]